MQASVPYTEVSVAQQEFTSDGTFCVTTNDKFYEWHYWVV